MPNLIRFWLLIAVLLAAGCASQQGVATTSSGVEVRQQTEISPSDAPKLAEKNSLNVESARDIADLQCVEPVQSGVAEELTAVDEEVIDDETRADIELLHGEDQSPPDEPGEPVSH